MLLKGKKGIIFGALDSKSIAWKVAEEAKKQGAKFVLTNAPIAMRMGEISDLADKCNSEIIPADATSMDDLENLFIKSQEILDGKIDFILHSIGMSINVRKGKHYTDLNHDFMLKEWMFLQCHFIESCKSMKLDAMNEWGSIVALSYIAAQRTFPDYNDMADNKAYLESIGRSFGYHLGNRKKFASILYLNHQL